MNILPSGGFLIGGYSNTNTEGDLNGLVIKTDGNGIANESTVSISPVVFDPSLSVNSVFTSVNIYSLPAVNGAFATYDNVCFGPPKPFSILAVRDVPNDQGKQVFVTWRNFEYDSLRPFAPTRYNVWRNDLGVWTHITEVPSRKDTILSVVAPTIFDSTIANGMMLSTFQVTAHGANDSDIAYTDVYSGYSVDNLKPMSPSGFIFSIMDNSVTLSWNAVEDKDFHHYAIYRSTENNFNPKGMQPLKVTGDLTYTDDELAAGTYYYKISAFDFSGNESDYSPAIRDPC